MLLLLILFLCSLPTSKFIRCQDYQLRAATSSLGWGPKGIILDTELAPAKHHLRLIQIVGDACAYWKGKRSTNRWVSGHYLSVVTFQWCWMAQRSLQFFSIIDTFFIFTNNFIDLDILSMLAPTWQNHEQPNLVGCSQLMCGFDHNQFQLVYLTVEHCLARNLQAQNFANHF